MSKTITAMYARKNFGQILNQTALLKESFVIERAGKPMAAIVSVDVLNSVGVDIRRVDDALENLIKKIKGEKSKKLEKAIAEAREAVKRLHDQ